MSNSSRPPVDNTDKELFNELIALEKVRIRLVERFIKEYPDTDFDLTDEDIRRAINSEFWFDCFKVGR